MMASLILTVGFVGVIEAVTVSATAMDLARRQTLATQIMEHEFEKLRLLPWDVAVAAPNELAINDLTTSSTAITIDSQFDAARLALGDNKSATAPVRFSLARTLTASNPVTNIREVNFTVTWVVKSSRRTDAGTQVSFTSSRSNSAWFGKYGLSLSYRQS